jgi:histone deacetylase complex regulatory component SIN3
VSAGNKGTVNAFMRFAQEERPRIKAEHPNFTLAEISHELGVRYNALGAAERARRKDDARAEIARAHADGGGNMANAIDFMDQVKVATSDEVYDEFLDALHQFKSKQIDVRSVILRVCKVCHMSMSSVMFCFLMDRVLSSTKSHPVFFFFFVFVFVSCCPTKLVFFCVGFQLLAGHRELILGFNAFLPQDYRIESHMLDANNHLKRTAFARRRGNSNPVPKIDADNNDSDNETATSTISSTSSGSGVSTSPRKAAAESLARASGDSDKGVDSANDFIASVKSRLDSATFKQFIAAMGELNEKKQATRDETVARITALLAGHTDLIREFKLFVPKSSRSSKTHSGSGVDAAGRRAMLAVPAEERKSRRRSMEHKSSSERVPTSKKAHAFLQRLDTEFPSQRRVGEKFISLVRGFQQQERSARDFFEKSSALLSVDPESDILDELMLFFPANMHLLYAALDGSDPVPSPPANRGATLRAPRTTSGENGIDDVRRRGSDDRAKTLRSTKHRGSDDTIKRKDKSADKEKATDKSKPTASSAATSAAPSSPAAPAVTPASAVPANIAKSVQRLESSRS